MRKTEGKLIIRFKSISVSSPRPRRKYVLMTLRLMASWVRAALGLCSKPSWSRTSKKASFKSTPWNAWPRTSSSARKSPKTPSSKRTSWPHSNANSSSPWSWPFRTLTSSISSCNAQQVVTPTVSSRKTHQNFHSTRPSGKRPSGSSLGVSF